MRLKKQDPASAYPIPYRLPTDGEIAADLRRVRQYLAAAMPARLVDRETDQPIADVSVPVGAACLDPGEASAFVPLAYEAGVLHSGMLAAAQATGDPAFSDFTARQFQFIADTLPYLTAQAEKFGRESNSARPILEPRALDDCGAMTAAMIRAQIMRIGPDLQPVIRPWTEFIAHRQFRLTDGSFARRRPMPVSVWADDFYMGVPALAEMGRLTGDRTWFADAVRAVLGMSARLFRPSTGLYTHGWHENSPDAPEFYWGRANGWAMLAMSDLLDVLPSDQPGRPDVLRQLQAQVRAVAALQSGQGLWHQMLDRNDSYLETSASAMFVYGISRAINQGWISPVTYGSIAQAGWQALSTRINAQGQVEGTCIGTTLAGDPVYYYHRPTSVYAVHGYGPMLLAGAEMIRLLRNPAFGIELKNRTYHYVPKS